MDDRFLDAVRRAARALPSAVAVEDEAGAWTYRELDDRVQSLAARLAGAGAGPGVRVALLAHGSREAIAAVHAVPRVGAALAPMSPAWSDLELREAVDTLRPEIIICDSKTERAALEAARARVGSRLVVSLRGEVAREAHSLDSVVPGEVREVPSDPDRPFAVLWTSGTEGSPRGVEITTGNLLASAAAVKERLGLAPDDVWYASLRVAHIGGLALIHRAAVVGSRVVVRSFFAPEDFQGLVDGGRITHASLVPVMLQRALELRGEAPAPSTLRCVLVGGAAASPSLIQRALDLGFPVALTYGLTEACSQVATAPPSLVRRKTGTVGAPLPGVEVRISEQSEILVRGPTLARRYVGVEEPFLRADGWLGTGDLGRLDEQGHLWVTGRVAQRIVSGGVNVDPHEVEEALKGHPEVMDVAVVGVPDPVWGERVVAAVVPRLGTSPGLQALLGYCKDRLSAAKRPREVVLVGELPRNPNGKVDRERVRAVVLARPGLR